MMKTRERLIIFTVGIMLLLLTACDKNKFNTTISKEAIAICGSWTYNHDKETVIAVFREDGTAQYEDKDYFFECDSQFIKLRNADGDTIQIRYLFDDEGMDLYSKNTYTFSGEGEPEGLIGEWSCEEKKWTFSFTDAGTFMEDGYFPGHYIIDDENSTFQLIYNDKFEDTVCYYQLEEKKLTIEYPWQMVRISDH